ncbi:STAS domain-containing protein [Streptomyces yunnanensis]|uniref:STAS domain-containing protein n=1 Tax=Streptomyces yunnanensis TaxID=156453 RepID=UPI0030B84B92
MAGPSSRRGRRRRRTSSLTSSGRCSRSSPASSTTNALLTGTSGSSATSSPDHIVVRLPKEVTFENAERIGKELQVAISSGPGVIEVDLVGVSHLSGDGGAAFFTALLAARWHGTRVIATHAGRQVRHTLDLRCSSPRATCSSAWRTPGPRSSVK